MFRLALRQTEGLVGSIIALLGLDLAVPDHTTMSRRAETLQVPRPRPYLGDKPRHLLVDSTGLKLCGAGEWLHEKHGTKTRRAWRTLHIGTDADTGQIVAATLTGSDACDASQVGLSLDQVVGPVASFTADGAYDWDSVYDEVAARHPEAAVIVPPRANAVPRGFRAQAVRAALLAAWSRSALLMQGRETASWPGVPPGTGAAAGWKP